MPIAPPARAFAAVPITVPTGPISTMQPTSTASSKKPTSPVSPDTISSLLRLQLQSHPSTKPPISPPAIHQGMARMTHANGAMPTLTRLPSLIARPSHHQQANSIPATHPRPTAAPVASYRQPVSPPSSTDAAAAPSPRELAARLALLLHARECCTPLDVERVCGVRNCRVARGVLDHCQECFLSEGECHRSCCEAKQLLRHFRVCSAQQFQRPCTVCDILRSEFTWAMQHARSVTPLFVQRDAAEQHQHHHLQQPLAQKRRHSYQDQRPHHNQQQQQASLPPMSLRRAVSEGPHATMSAMGHHKRSAPCATSTHMSGHQALPSPMAKRVRILTPPKASSSRA